jgi:flagellar biosynthetic protein FliR
MPMPHGSQLEWTSFLAAMTLALVRISGMVAFAPFFSSTALPLRTKAVFVGAVAYLLAPLVAALPGARVSLGFSALLGELAVGLVYGLTLTLLNEMMLFAGQILGLQFSFSMVNLLDPTSSIQTPLLGDLFQLMGTLVVIGSGLDRILIASMVRSFRVAPLGNRIDLKEGATVEDLVQELQRTGAGARDVISILQAMKEAGALEADLEVL